MAQIVPLIRAAALVPMIRWMAKNRRPLHDMLRAADLGYFSIDEPDRPIPLLNVASFFREAGRREGPDIAARTVSATSILDLGLLARAVIGARTPREALKRIIEELPQHCSHEVISLRPYGAGAIIREGWMLVFDDETLHLVQQYVAALVAALMGMTGAPPPHLARVRMLPHPQAGLSHLRPLFGDVLDPSHDRSLEILIGERILDRSLPDIGRDRIAGSAQPAQQLLRGDGSLAWTAKVALHAMLADGRPTIDRLARAAGMSRRTLQRRLAGEGTSFSTLLEDVRRHTALSSLAGDHHRLGDLSASLGYAQQSTFTRAVRRWTGLAPRSMRSG